MESHNAGIRTIGIHALRQLIHDEGITEAEGYGPLASNVRSRSRWTKDKKDRWAKLRDPRMTSLSDSCCGGVLGR
jgi:hypothetical protein